MDGVKNSSDFAIVCSFLHNFSSEISIDLTFNQLAAYLEPIYTGEFFMLNFCDCILGIF